MGLTVGTASGGSISGVGTAAPSSLSVGTAAPGTLTPVTWSPQQGTSNPQSTVNASVLQPAGNADINQTPYYTATGGGSGGGGGGASGTGGSTYDPYAAARASAAAAAAAEAARVAKAESDWNTAKDVQMNSIKDAEGTAANAYQSGILDYIDTYKRGQIAIDRSSVQNELAREQGRLGILDMVGNGIRSGGVTLNNANAANSSASDMLAKAYGIMGRQEMTKVGNQYALGQNNIDAQQADLDTQADTFRRHAQESKVDSVNSLVASATQQLAQLNSAAMYANITDRVAIEQEKARIRDEAMAKLTGLDSTLSDGLGGIHPADAATNRAAAEKLLTAGTAPEKSFDYTSTVPANFQDTGPFAANLPIFVGKRSNDNTTGV